MAHRTRLVLWRAAGLALLPIVNGCVVQQYGSDQVPDINVAATELKDDQYVGMPAQVDSIVAAYLAQPGAPPGCAVGIMENNAITRVKGYGLADTGGEAFTHGTPSVVGSVSKTWTALAVLRLVELGYVDLQDTVSDHLPSVPQAWQSITIQQLLSHTSGLQREPLFTPGINNEVELSQFLFPSFPIIVHLGIHPRLVYYSYQQTPVVGFDGTNTARYSNIGYMLLGAIVDTVVVQNDNAIGSDFASYESFVWRYVGLFDGNLSNGDQMLSQCLNEYWRQTDIRNLAKGYTYQAGGDVYVQTTFGNSSLLQLGPAGWEGPPGAWTMTIGDLVRLMAAIQNDDIVTPATKTLMMQTYGSDSSGNWGLGVNLITKLGRPVYMHDGAYPGYRARYTVWPGEDFGVAIMANESEAGMRDITDDIATVFIGPSVPPAGGTIIDEDDPGLGGDVSEEHVEPDLTNEERDVFKRELDQLEADQLLAEQQRNDLAEVLANGGCDTLSEDILAEHGFDLAVPIAECYETSTTEQEFDVCIRLATGDLVRAGIITAAEQAELQRCATFTYRFPCLADLDGDGLVGVADLLMLLAGWGGPGGDVDGNNDTDTQDLLFLLARWGPC